MEKVFTKRLFVLVIFVLFILKGVVAQTITIGTVDAGPYGQGSTIAVPITINDAGGCISQINTFNLYLSDASGSFAPGTLIGSYTGFYIPFINGVLPTGLTASANYKVQVRTTSPITTSVASNAFTINNVTGVTASASSPQTIGSEVFGMCIGTDGATFTINNTSAAGTTSTASFLNEQTQGFEGTNIAISSGAYTFTAKASNYNVIVKTVNSNGTVGTYSYELVNNPIRNNMGSTGSGIVCLTSSGTGVLSFNIDVSSAAAGIQVNYPGNTYIFNWGDGSTSTTFTFCQLKALGGIVSHTFTLPSCGHTASGFTNSFNVQNHASSPYCGEVSSAPSVAAKVIVTPTTKFKAPAVACTGTALTIPNTSDPGPDYSMGAASSCAPNKNARYDWSFDGTPVAAYTDVTLGQSFVIPATVTTGNHTITLHARTPPIGCPSADYTQTICFEKPPVPVFSIPNGICITDGPVIPTNTSTIDATCSVDTYSWITSGPGTITYAGGTTVTSALPQFVFSVPGIYTIQLGINSGGCGLVKATAQTIKVDGSPTATLSPDVTICGNNLTLKFDPTQTVTKTTLTGTASTQPTTYTWTITGGSFTFLGGTDTHSQYPEILFADFATYTIQVTHQNGCGTITKTQVITFVQAPTVDAGTDQNICASSPVVALNGSITGSYTSYQWVGGSGVFSAGRNSLSTNYTPTPAEITAGTVNLTLQASTALPAPCNKVTDDIIITITPTAVVSSPAIAKICSGQHLGYTITANTGSTFVWTSVVTSGTVTGYTAAGTGSSIDDVLINTTTADAVVTYTIIPTIGACTGTTFTLTVTVHPLPIITAVPVGSTICSNDPANITLTSNLGGTMYTWTSVASAGISGNTNQVTPVLVTSIQDILRNTGTTSGTVTYTITPYNGICPGAPPVTASVIVNPQTPVANAGLNFDICNETTITLTGNNPSPFNGVWTQTAGPATTIASPTNYTTLVTGLSKGKVYTFKWTITGLPPCGDTFATITIGAFADVNPGFTMDQTHGCGSTTVTFINTSTPTPSGTFTWNFGDGSPEYTGVTPPPHTYAPLTDGTEKEYTIVLTPTSNCDLHTSYINHIKISPAAPVALLLPNQSSSCGAFTLTAQNLSPGNNAQYDFYLKNSDGIIVQHLTYDNKSPAVFSPINPTSTTYYTVYVVATDQCGNQSTSVPENIAVTPSSLVSQIQIKGNVNSVCLGSSITFQNISTGGNRFTITVYDADHHPILTVPAGTDDMNYTPAATGTYYVSIIAGANGCGDAPVSELKQFIVYPNPLPNFTYTSDKDYNVIFNNTTPGIGDIPASSVIYQWDFGDGSTKETSFIPNTHHFDFAKSPFTVTLKATTPGSSCFALISQIISVKFTGNIFVPNAFMPGSSNREVNVFRAKGTGLKTWHMQIFNNFGQLIWESTKLNNGSPVEGWDGTYKGQIVEQGVYIWQISATLLNGEEWKGASFHNSSPSRVGVIHLIR